MKDVKPPNYSTHAIEFFLDVDRMMTEQGLFEPVRQEAFIANLLTEAVKFLLPDNGVLLQMEHDYKPSMYDLVRLPYPVCALEFPANQDLFAEASGLNFSGKRISLCFDPHKLSDRQKKDLQVLTENNDLYSDLPENALCVFSIFDIPEHSIWASSVGFVCLDLDDEPIPLEQATEKQKIIPEHVRSRLGGAKPTKHGLPATFYPFFYRAALAGADHDRAIENLYIDTIDELRAAFDFLAALNCSNVGLDSIPAPKMLNKKRLQKKKTPFFEYKILDIDLGPSTQSTGGHGGGHSSPRTHLRRGHIRQLGERAKYKVVWVNAAIVRPGAPEGVIDKTYRVKR